MVENEDWNWSEETLKAIIEVLIDNKESWEKDINSDFDQWVVMGYEFALDSIKTN